MVLPLVVLAVLATLGGFVGVGPAFKFLTGSDHPGGRVNIVNWLDPVIWNSATREFGKEHAVADHSASAAGDTTAAESALASSEHAPAASHSSWFNLAHAADSALGSHTAAEWLFIVISLAVAALGILLGMLFYLWRPGLPDVWAARLRPLYQASYNKYWVDEFFGWAVTRRVMDAARAVYAIDSRVVDGVVNGTAASTRGLSRITGGVDKYFVDGLVNTIAGFIIRLMSPLFRAAQTGFAQNYALVMVLGLVAAVAIFFGTDIMKAFRAFFAIGFLD
jgi:NADH:ubiquinone oxidoreductase subunit 5 (subunit L)/multisubunit Na+/H+ antiporter MnhA subunit